MAINLLQPLLKKRGVSPFEKGRLGGIMKSRENL